MVLVVFGVDTLAGFSGDKPCVLLHRLRHWTVRTFCCRYKSMFGVLPLVSSSFLLPPAARQPAVGPRVLLHYSLRH